MPKPGSDFTEHSTSQNNTGQDTAQNIEISDMSEKYRTVSNASPIWHILLKVI